MISTPTIPSNVSLGGVSESLAPGSSIALGSSGIPKILVSQEDIEKEWEYLKPDLKKLSQKL